MKKILVLTLMTTLILGACAAQGNIQPADLPASQPTALQRQAPSASDEPTPLSRLNNPVSAKGALVWDTSPNVKIITATFCCGFAPEIIKTNYIPAAQVWGDGRIIWVENLPDGGRKVLQGQLTQAELTALLDDADRQGFFSWSENYTSPLAPADGANQCLSIHLSERSHTVCEYFKGAPQAFHKLYDKLASGSGVNGKAFIPARVYLVTVPQKNPSIDKTQALHKSESGNPTESLASASQGMWIEGSAVNELWDHLNAQPFGLLQENNQYYMYSLQVPGVSLVEPPAPH